MLWGGWQVVDRVTAAHEKLEFGETGRAFYDFFWSQFADWYIESAKTRLYGDDAEAAQSTRAVRPFLLSPAPDVSVSACPIRVR